jgi:hypothetical protein
MSQTSGSPDFCREMSAGPTDGQTARRSPIEILADSQKQKAMTNDIYEFCLQYENEAIPLDADVLQTARSTEAR